MLNKLRKQEGFTLIELLIVVAIIGILAAIAIPQFAKYRIQGYNSSALSDIGNLRKSEESLYAEWQHYGRTDKVAVPGSGGWGNSAATVTGPSSAANPTVITTTDAVGTARGTNIPVGNNIGVFANTDAAAGASFVAVSKHTQGDTTYASDSDNTSNFKDITTLIPSDKLAGNEAKTAIGASVPNADDVTGKASFVAM